MAARITSSIDDCWNLYCQKDIYMKMSETSLKWALTHLERENDTDLFSEPIEIEIVNQQKAEIVRFLKEVDLGTYSWHPFRRFMVPKGELSYRMIT